MDDFILNGVLSFWKIYGCFSADGTFNAFLQSSAHSSSAPKSILQIASIYRNPFSKKKSLINHCFSSLLQNILLIFFQTLADPIHYQ